MQAGAILTFAIRHEMTLAEVARLLQNQKITSRQLVEDAFAAIKDPRGEGARTLLTVHESESLAAADRQEADGHVALTGRERWGRPGGAE